MNPNHPTFHFNSLIPRLLNTGAVTFWGHCFVRRSYITPHHRAHETYHHLEAVRKGRLMHLVTYLWGMAEGLVGTRFRRIVWEAQGQRVSYFAAYYHHPEEVAARAYADENAHRYTRIGVQS